MIYNTYRVNTVYTQKMRNGVIYKQCNRITWIFIVYCCAVFAYDCVSEGLVHWFTCLHCCVKQYRIRTRHLEDLETLGSKVSLVLPPWHSSGYLYNGPSLSFLLGMYSGQRADLWATNHEIHCWHPFQKYPVYLLVPLNSYFMWFQENSMVCWWCRLSNLGHVWVIDALMWHCLSGTMKAWYSQVWGHVILLICHASWTGLLRDTKEPRLKCQMKIMSQFLKKNIWNNPLITFNCTDIYWTGLHNLVFGHEWNNFHLNPSITTSHAMQKKSVLIAFVSL